MELQKRESPLISTAFYQKLISVFPNVSSDDITPNADMIELQRKAAHQEVINYIGKHVGESYKEIKPLPKWKVKLIEVLRK